ncbi:unnamed protein product [Gordionus sp. m RMFG-2023]
MIFFTLTVTFPLIFILSLLVYQDFGLDLNFKKGQITSPDIKMLYNYNDIDIGKNGTPYQIDNYVIINNPDYFDVADRESTYLDKIMNEGEAELAEIQNESHRPSNLAKLESISYSNLSKIIELNDDDINNVRTVNRKEELEKTKSVPNVFTNLSNSKFSFDTYQRTKNLTTEYLTKYLFANKSIKCNDGSTAGYYLRRHHNSKKWLIYLEGGWFCYSKETCEKRFRNTPGLMSSSNWPSHLKYEGILSNDRKNNPFWYNYNIIYLPYCSSDLWSGRSQPLHKNNFTFMGSYIIEETIKEMSNKGLKLAERLLLLGTSAGGIGVVLNLDKIKRLLWTSKKNMKILGVADSAWFLEHDIPLIKVSDDIDREAIMEKLEKNKIDPQFEDFNTWTSLAHISSIIHLPIHGIQQGLNYWNGDLPINCIAKFTSSERWKCYFIHNALSTLKSPLFVFQWLFDEAQMIVDKVGIPEGKDQWDYINNMGERLRLSFGNVS